MAETKPQEKPTLDQRRARHAWESVCSLAKTENGRRTYGDEAKEYAREAKKLPTRIRAAGLGQALAFLAAKSSERKKSLSRLLEHLTAWVIQERPMAAARPENLLESVIYGNSDFLRRATDEALAYLQWLNRFAEAEGLMEGEE